MTSSGCQHLKSWPAGQPGRRVSSVPPSPPSPTWSPWSPRTATAPWTRSSRASWRRGRTWRRRWGRWGRTSWGPPCPPCPPWGPPCPSSPCQPTSMWRRSSQIPAQNLWSVQRMFCWYAPIKYTRFCAKIFYFLDKMCLRVWRDCFLLADSVTVRWTLFFNS